MSYILEALKKSEQERGHGAAPGIQTMHSSSLHYTSNKRPVWPFVLIAVVVANLALLVFMAYTKDSSNTSAATQDKAITEPAVTQQASMAESTANTQSKIASQPAVTHTTDNQSARKNLNMSPVQYKPENPVVHVHELPLAVKRNIPAMEFSAHIYSSNPAHRSIVINGDFMEEGEQISNELTLTEITSKGAIFSFRGYRFRTEVVSSWDVN